MMDNFCPDWCSPTGDTILELMEDQGVSREDLARYLEIGLDELECILYGENPLTTKIAISLAWKFSDGNIRDLAAFFLRRDVDYWMCTQRVARNDSN